MKYKIIPVTLFQQNCTLLWCEKSVQGAVVDPGGDIEKIFHQIEQLKLTITQILLTHGHLDHVGAAAELAEQLNVPIYGPQEEDRFWLEKLTEQSQQFGLMNCRPFTPTRWLQEGERISVGEEELQVFHCPGHTPGHVVFFNQKARLAQVGDVLFKGSIGRTDFPGGDHQALIDAIKTKLWPLGRDVTFIPGHGPISTFGEERESNVFVRDIPSC